MTISLSNAGQRFESTFKTEQGFPFPAALMPISEGSVPSYDFSVPRHILRVRRHCPVVTGAVVLSPDKKRYLLADHDVAVSDNEVLYRTHRVFNLNKQTLWQREQTILDPLTQMEKGTGRVTLQSIWIMDEYVQREEIDLAFRVKETTRKVITGANIRLGDILMDMSVTRIDEVLGVKLIELR